MKHFKYISTILLFIMGTFGFSALRCASDFDVDLVYLWCDGADPRFKKEKDYWLKKEGKTTSAAIADGRFVQVDELKYSLRSVEKYLPWIHHIYIVTDRQIPIWLNTKHPKITIIDHSEIIQKKYLPVFNSSAIETAIYKIPGLSEHFLYANDDMFVNRPLDKNFFFKDGKPIIRVFPYFYKQNSLYLKMLLYAIDLMERDFGSIPPFSKRRLWPHHNIDAYLKSDYAACAEHYKKEYTETLKHRFRKETSVQRLIVSMWSFMSGHAELKELPRKGQSVDSIYKQNTEKDYLKILSSSNPALFCINDVEKSTQNDRIRCKQFLENYFPQKSEFEKAEESINPS